MKYGLAIIRSGWSSAEILRIRRFPSEEHRGIYEDGITDGANYFGSEDEVCVLPLPEALGGADEMPEGLTVEQLRRAWDVR